MSFKPIPTAMIDFGKPNNSWLIQKVRDNFEDHQARLNNLSNANISYGNTVVSQEISNGAIDVLSVTITTTGKPVFLLVQGLNQNTGGMIFIRPFTPPFATGSGNFTFWRGNRLFNAQTLEFANINPVNYRYGIPCSALSIIDMPPAGMNVYRLQISSPTNTWITGIENSQLVAVELK